MSSQDTYNEKKLLTRLREGHVEAFEEIFRRFWHRLYVVAHAKLQSHDEAEEVVQSIFTTLWERREILFITNLSHYLYTSVKYKVLNIVRSRITEEKYWAYYKAFVPAGVHLTEQAVDFNELNDVVEDAVNLLPEKSRQVFKLSRLEGRSITEIANMLQLSEKAIEYHLTKSLRELRVHLRDFSVNS